MQKKRLSKKFMLMLFFLAIVGITTTFSQAKKAGIMKFDKTVHDFGVLEEKKGNASYKFVFENTGDKPIVISRVRASCGCTSPSWTRKPVLPGETGYVQATYKVRGRPGAFSKSVTVYSNSSTPRQSLRIKGRVTPKAKSVAELYPNKVGDLWLSTQHASFAKIRNTQEKTFVLKGYNSSDKKITFELKKLPEFITAEVPRKQVEPKEKINIPLKFNAKLMKKHWGFTSDNYPIYINGKTSKDYSLKVSATIVEDFSALSSEERANAPVININEKVFDFKELKQGETKVKEFTIVNKGKSNLIIRKIDTGGDFISARMRKTIIAPNGKSILKVKFHSKHREKGKQYRFITLICNDPRGSVVRIKVVGSIV